MASFSTDSHKRGAFVKLHESDSDSDMDETHDAIQTKGDRLTQPLMRRGASASPAGSPPASPRDSSATVSTRKNFPGWPLAGKHYHRYWKRYLLASLLVAILVAVTVLVIVRPWVSSSRSAPLENKLVKALPANQPLWPIPKTFSFGSDSVVLSTDFAIEISPSVISTLLLDKAISRSIKALRAKQNQTSTPASWVPPPLPQPSAGKPQHPLLASLSIQVKDPKAALAYGMDEAYTLSISAATTGASLTPSATLTANTQWGVLRGLETFVQLVHPTDLAASLQTADSLPTLGIANVPWMVEDEPRYSHRGLMLDTSRNYYPVKDILRTLDGMALVKLNVFHWHVLDQQTYPLVSKAFPQLTQYGAEAWDRVYTPEDVAAIIQYGEERGIRVVPEFDAPGHTASWGRAFPNITVCVDAQPHSKYAAEPPAGQLNPLEPFAYKVLNTLIGEWAAQFPDKQAHTGGDEINFECWKTNDRIRDYIQQPSRRKEYEKEVDDELGRDDPLFADRVEDGQRSQGTSGGFGFGRQSGEDQLLDFYLRHQYKMYEARGKTPLVWEEVALEHDVRVPKNAIVQVWKNAANAKKVIEKGYPVILSSGEYWYLDCGHGQWGIGGQGQSWCPYSSWQRMYSYSLTEGLSAEQQKQVYGGEVCMWSEQTDTHNLDPTVWPRSAAAAEILWSGSQDTQGRDRPLLQAAKRMVAIRQQLIDLGISPAPIFPSWCGKHPEGCLV